MTKILAIEDDAINQDLIASALGTKIKEEEYQLEFAKTCGKAKKAIKNTRFDLIILNVEKECLCGLEILDIISDKKKPTRTLLIASEIISSETILKALSRKRVSMYLSKPFKVEELEEAISLVLTHCTLHPLRNPRKRQTGEMEKEAIISSISGDISDKEKVELLDEISRYLPRKQLKEIESFLC